MGGWPLIKDGLASPSLNMLTFKVLTQGSFKVIVFNLSGVVVVVKCGQHDPTLAMIEDL